MTEAISIALGFIFTTLVGGWWAARLQQRSWDHQNDLRIKEEESRRAGEACHDLAGLLDKRLYRMRRLFWAIKGYDGSTQSEHTLAARLTDYNEVLYEWNDRLNGNLAVVGSHFGPAVRHWLNDLYEQFRRVGSDLEACVPQVRKGMDVSSRLEVIDRQFEGWHPDTLNNRVYLLCLSMMTQIRDGQVGRSAPDKLSIPSLDHRAEGSS
ncbi:MAG: hypothetical protein M3325_07095 [Actinomycetota bacterium]|nr:hypothetical protein [Actinomycetota bacterium]